MKKLSFSLILLLLLNLSTYSQKTEQKSSSTNDNKQTNEEIEMNKKYDECHLLLFNGATVELTSNTSSEVILVNSKEIKNEKYTIKIGFTKDEVDKIGKSMGIEFKKKSNKYWVLMNVLMKFQNGKLVELPGLIDDPELFF